MRDRGARTDQIEVKIKNRKQHQFNLTKRINEEAIVSQFYFMGNLSEKYP